MTDLSSGVETNGVGIRTKGVGSFCMSHLNLTVSLADVWAREDAPPAVRRRRPKHFQPKGIPYAGFDPTEQQVRVIVKAQEAVS